MNLLKVRKIIAECIREENGGKNYNREKRSGRAQIYFFFKKKRSELSILEAYYILVNCRK